MYYVLHKSYVIVLSSKYPVAVSHVYFDEFVHE